MTKKECIKNHRIMWNWLADNPDKEKVDWPGWVDYPGRIRAGCFLCEYTISRDLSCSKCPLDWEYPHCNAWGASFREYKLADDFSEKAYYARKIANLKEREEN